MPGPFDPVFAVAQVAVRTADHGARALVRTAGAAGETALGVTVEGVHVAVAVADGSARFGLGLASTGIRQTIRLAATPPAETLEALGAVARPIVDLPHRHRRTWHRDDHLHIELRELDDEAAARFRRRLVEELVDVDGVRGAEVHAALGRVVVERGEHSLDADLVEVVERVEAGLGVADAPLGVDRPDHPVDLEPIVRSILTLGADATGFWLAVVGRVLRFPRLTVEIDTAAALAVADNIPAVRRRLERRLTHPVAELGLAVSGGLASGLAQGLLGPVTDVVLRGLLLDESISRRRAYLDREPALTTGSPATAGGALMPPVRPTPLRNGPIESYTATAWTASLVGAGGGLVLTRSVDRALALLVSGLPKAARLGREAYAARVGSILAGRGVIVRDPAALRRLDRIDVVIVEADLLVHRHLDNGAGAAVELESQAPDILATARRLDLEIVLVSDRPGSLAILDVETIVAPEAIAEHVRRTQVDGRGVLVIGSASLGGLELADVSLGLSVGDAPPPLQAHLIGSDELADAFLVLEAVDLARRVSRQSAGIALAGASTSALVSLAGRTPGATRGVLTTLNTAALAAIVNGARTGYELQRRSLPVHRDLVAWHALATEECLSRLATSERGLSGHDAELRRAPAERSSPAPVELLRAVGQELVNPLTPVLVAAGGLSVATGSFSDASLIGTVVVLNAAIGGVQTFQAERSIARLMRREHHRIHTRRDGSLQTRDEDELVPGDVIELEAGEIVPADCRILHSQALEVDESSLTGESLPVVKGPAPVGRDTVVADRTSMLYEGTSIAAGRVTAVVADVGGATEARRGVLLARSGPPDQGVEVRLEELTSTLLPVSVLSGLAVVGAGVLRRIPLGEVVGSGVSLAVAAVPEGLPLLATVAQRAAARRLTDGGVIVSNARAIEALGRVDVLCVDKTGTLTDGRIRVHLVADAHHEAGLDDLDDPLADVLAAAMRATPAAEGTRRSPHPTDRALHHAADDTDVTTDRGVQGWTRGDEVPFEPARGYHATTGRDADGWVLSVKGAPEVVLPRCAAVRRPGGDVPLDGASRREVAERIEQIAGRGIRVLCVAERRQGLADLALGSSSDEIASLVDELTLLGVVGLRDGLRPTAADAVAALSSAGVDVIMITGDHPVTAGGIARDLGLDGSSALITGAEIDGLGDDELARALAAVRVCARVTPLHKARIVRALQQIGRTVAMTGDGANDAAAIRLADVGIALGTRATPAARDAADLVVTDDRIETIVTAVAEGRGLWVSARDAVAVLVGGNLGEMAVTVAGAALTGRSPLNARQLLLTNLLTDVAPALTIAGRRPRDLAPEVLLAEGPDEALGAELEVAIRRRALVTASAAGSAWALGRLTGTAQRASTITLVSLVGTQLAQTVRDGRGDPAVTLAGVGSGLVLAAIVQTPGLSQAFGCRPLGPLGWLTAAGTTVGALTVSEVGAQRAAAEVAQVVRDATHRLPATRPSV